MTNWENLAPSGVHILAMQTVSWGVWYSCSGDGSTGVAILQGKFKDDII